MGPRFVPSETVWDVEIQVRRFIAGEMCRTGEDE